MTCDEGSRRVATVLGHHLFLVSGVEYTDMKESVLAAASLTCQRTKTRQAVTSIQLFI